MAKRFEEKTNFLLGEFEPRIAKVDATISKIKYYALATLSLSIACGYDICMRHNGAGGNVSPQKPTESKMVAATEEQLA